jgi:hypothetical protein
MKAWVYVEEFQGVTQEVSVHASRRGARAKVRRLLAVLRNGGTRIVRNRKTRAVDWERTNDFEHWAQVFECEVRA